jgi:hypothetical protein
MSTIINADTSNGLKLTSDTSGEIALQSAGTTIATVDSTGIAMASGKVLAPTGPAFSAHLTANQSITTTTFTKIAFDAELFDTNNNFDTSTYRFTPTVAGYYQFNGIAYLSATKGAQLVTLYKNGSELARGDQQINNTTASTRGMNLSYLAYANGSSDYFELYARHTTGTTQNIIGTSQQLTYFQAYLARAA